MKNVHSSLGLLAFLFGMNAPAARCPPEKSLRSKEESERRIEAAQSKRLRRQARNLARI